MPAESVVQARAARVAENAPGKLYDRNRGLLKMKLTKLRKFSRTKEKGLPYTK
jgi:hypothetical protein